MWIRLVQHSSVLAEAPLTVASEQPVGSEPPECMIEPWECGEVEDPEACGEEFGRYIVVFNDWVEDPEALARAQVEKYGGVLGFIYRYALKGYSAGYPESVVPELENEPSVKYVEVDQPVELFGTSSEGQPRSFDGCGEEPPQPEEPICMIPEGCPEAEEPICMIPEGCPESLAGDGSTPNDEVETGSLQPNTESSPFVRQEGGNGRGGDGKRCPQRTRHRRRRGLSGSRSTAKVSDNHRPAARPRVCKSG